MTVCSMSALGHPKLPLLTSAVGSCVTESAGGKAPSRKARIPISMYIATVLRLPGTRPGMSSVSGLLNV